MILIAGFIKYSCTLTFGHLSGNISGGTHATKRKRNLKVANITEYNTLTKNGDITCNDFTLYEEGHSAVVETSQ